MAVQGPFWAQITYIFSFHGGSGNNESPHIPKDTLHEFFGRLASGLWPDNALNFDILAIYGGSRSFLGFLDLKLVAIFSSYPLIFWKLAGQMQAAMYRSEEIAKGANSYARIIIVAATNFKSKWASIVA